MEHTGTTIRTHFLFNAFNTIAMMVRQKKSDAAVEMIGGLSDMFRMSLNKESRQFVKLKDEIELLKKYLAIESVRYQDRLSVIWDIDENTLKYQVPNFVLQPIVENAFKHGISKSLDQATLGIYTRKEASHLILEVFNSGAAFSSTWELQKDKGIGLSNTIDSLLNLYKEDFKFLINEKDNGVSVVLKIPVIS
jgi:LytS/YehU family sensor histidine kinase